MSVAAPKFVLASITFTPGKPSPVDLSVTLPAILPEVPAKALFPINNKKKTHTNATIFIVFIPGIPLIFDKYLKDLVQ